MMTIRDRHSETVETAHPQRGRVAHYRRPEERPVTRGERDDVTFLWGGLTSRHEVLISAAMRGLGYRVETLPAPTRADYMTGKEYGNNGMCNPAHFTAGSLINFLKRLRDEQGVSTEDIIRRYAYYTAGSFGPCRFGMYEAEYRLALRNSGFDGFRVLLFQQKGGMRQSGDECAVELNTRFAVALLNGVIMGDVLNDLAYQIRPYETIPGQTDRVFKEVTQRIADRLREKGGSVRKGRGLSKVLGRLLPGLDANTLEPFIDQITDDYYLETLDSCTALIDKEIEVDFLRVKPVVKVTGEFWAQTTEGDGNFRLFSFLESQGAEVIVEPLMGWADYLSDAALCKAAERRASSRRSDPGGFWNVAERSRILAGYWKRRFMMRLGQTMLRREFNRVRRALGGIARPVIDQSELRRLAQPFYDTRLAGGEAYLEIAKTIYYAVNRQAHMVLSVKPFGCLPSTQSDGAQAAVLARYPEAIFLSVETAGEGEINAYSRIQMALEEAKEAARAEFNARLAACGASLHDIRAYCAAHAELRRPLQTVSQRDGVCGRAANFLFHAAARIGERPGRHDVV